MSLGKNLLTGLARLFGVSLIEIVKDRDDVVLEIEPTAEELTELAADRTDADREATTEILETFAEQLDRDPDEVFWKPVDEIREIPDRPQDTYIWILEPGVGAAGFADQIDSMYREHFGREPRGLHVPVEGVEEIRLADPGELRTYVEPHLTRAEQHEQHAAELEDQSTASSGGD